MLGPDSLGDDKRSQGWSVRPRAQGLLGTAGLTQGLFQNSQGLGTSLVRNCQAQDMGFPWDNQSGLGDGQGLSRSALPKLCMCELILTLLLIQSDQVLDPVIDPITTSLLSASPAPST